jgi:hypothetical protein
MNELRSHPGLFFVAVLVLIVCSIPVLRATNHYHRLVTMPGDAAPHPHSVLG